MKPEETSAGERQSTEKIPAGEATVKRLHLFLHGLFDLISL
jgi:hypothetical protein